MAKLVSKTYGDALFDAAVEEKKIDLLYEEVKEIKKIFSENRDYIKLINHPKLPLEEKISLIERAFKGKCSDIMLGFLVTTVEKSRFVEIDKILDVFLDEVREYKKIGVAYVASASELSDKQKKQVEEKLLNTTNYQSFNMHFRVDDSLIGGIVIKIGDRVLDSSIKTKLEHMSKDLMQIQLNN